MANKGKRQEDRPESTAVISDLAGLTGQSQLDFELSFFGGILDRHPDYVDVLRVMGNLLTQKGRLRDGLEVHQRLARGRPADPLAHYNLASSFALLKRVEPALKALRRAIELGYRDFRYMREDKDLDAIRHDPRYRQLIREFNSR